MGAAGGGRRFVCLTAGSPFSSTRRCSAPMHHAAGTQHPSLSPPASQGLDSAGRPGAPGSPGAGRCKQGLGWRWGWGLEAAQRAGCRVRMLPADPPGPSSGGGSGRGGQDLAGTFLQPRRTQICFRERDTGFLRLLCRALHVGSRAVSDPVPAGPRGQPAGMTGAAEPALGCDVRSAAKQGRAGPHQRVAGRPRGKPQGGRRALDPSTAVLSPAARPLREGSPSPALPESLCSSGTPSFLWGLVPVPQRLIACVAGLPCPGAPLFPQPPLGRGSWSPSPSSSQPGPASLSPASPLGPLQACPQRPAPWSPLSSLQRRIWAYAAIRRLRQQGTCLLPVPGVLPCWVPGPALPSGLAGSALCS